MEKAQGKCVVESYIMTRSGRDIVIEQEVMGYDSARLVINISQVGLFCDQLKAMMSISEDGK